MEKAQSDWGRQGWSRKVSAPLSLSPFLLVGFILSDSSHLQKILPNSLSSLQCFWQLWDLAAACSSCCSQEPPGVNGDFCAHFPPPAVLLSSLGSQGALRERICPCGIQGHGHLHLSLAENSMGPSGQRIVSVPKNSSPLSWLLLPAQLWGNSKAFGVFRVPYEKLCLFSLLFLTELSSSSQGMAQRSSADLQPCVLVTDPQVWIHSNVFLIHGNHLSSLLKPFLPKIPNYFFLPFFPSSLLLPSICKSYNNPSFRISYQTRNFTSNPQWNPTYTTDMLQFQILGIFLLPYCPTLLRCSCKWAVNCQTI